MAIEQNTPTDKVLAMMKEGKSKDNMMQSLQEQGFNNQQINEAFNQASIKQGVQGPEIAQQNENPAGSMPAEDYHPSEKMQISEIDKDEIPVPAPSPSDNPIQPQAPMGNMPSPQEMAQAYQQQPPVMPTPSISYDDVQSLVEEVIDEKWRDLMASIGDITSWKVRMGDEVEAIKQEILRVQNRFDNLQSSVLGKVDSYSKGINELGTEMKALEKVFEKIVEPLATNIKELSRITDALRKHHSK
ncbi:MAG: hypothetical protein U9Q69_06395 [Nanoarchaeota archaeon]|nr:hypothetical protein [Nanoarchaeota archaeon]